MVSAEPPVATVDPAVAGEPQYGSVERPHRFAGSELPAEHHGCTAETTHDDAGLVWLAAFAVPALEQLTWPVRIGMVSRPSRRNWSSCASVGRAHTLGRPAT